jgi:hypothetical protein
MRRFVLDGANIAYRSGASGLGAIDLHRLPLVVAALRDRFGSGAEVQILLDGSTSMALRRAGGIAAAELAEALRDGLVTQTPGCADPYLLQMAREGSYVVVSNDAFRDHPESIGILRLPFTIVGDRAWFLAADLDRISPSLPAPSSAPHVPPAPAPSPTGPRALLLDAIVRLLASLGGALRMEELGAALHRDPSLRALVEALPGRKEGWLRRLVASHAPHLTCTREGKGKPWRVALTAPTSHPNDGCLTSTSLAVA